MSSKNIAMYAEKRYELEELKNKIIEAFDKRHSRVEFAKEILRELGETRTLLLIYEKYFFRTESHAALVIMLSEHEGYQSADIIATGGKERLFSWGAEDDFLQIGKEVLQDLGFQG